MASRRQLKKEIDKIIIDAIDECYSVQLYQNLKKNESDNLIDEIVDFRDLIIKKIYNSKEKSEYRKIIEEVESKAELFFERINSL